MTIKAALEMPIETEDQVQAKIAALSRIIEVTTDWAPQFSVSVDNIAAVIETLHNILVSMRQRRAWAALERTLAGSLTRKLREMAQEAMQRADA